MEAQQSTQSGNQSHKGFPWEYVIGFILSLVLTAIAFWLVLSSPLPVNISLTISVFLGIIQVFIQLLLFMHLNEGNSAWVKKTAIYFGLFIAFTVVAGSLWIMEVAMDQRF
ncbi:cytochrome aa3 quinol oxidase subunit IV [Aneurinibacillus sp. Ricciae_BoGa-3]|uniref:cytochrome aa3 quinol oxidase subunit IV n=1 Tax=Aneurinibacillus sp. Ricciae_BoGa-3 TaxID=3022697 RepID=UPI0023418581|nr:cytochrome aa3 quinol oxidase subunit IV [Aneurinibacillus sp. Ricciae_BoGa-3]WCK54449.1 cytochrome aa3 quinol oxidase subunit IV [Aneurinibacillus sp. Ricciae_BoGa-3]